MNRLIFFEAKKQNKIATEIKLSELIKTIIIIK